MYRIHPEESKPNEQGRIQKFEWGRALRILSRTPPQIGKYVGRQRFRWGANTLFFLTNNPSIEKKVFQNTVSQKVSFPDRSFPGDQFPRGTFHQTTISQKAVSQKSVSFQTSNFAMFPPLFLSIYLSVSISNYLSTYLPVYLTI